MPEEPARRQNEKMKTHASIKKKGIINVVLKQPSNTAHNLAGPLLLPNMLLFACSISIIAGQDTCLASIWSVDNVCDSRRPVSRNTSDGVAQPYL